MRALKAFGIWLVILCCAVLNGVLREFALVPAIGAPAALVASGMLLCLVVVLVSALLVPRLGPLSARAALCVGAFWLALTLAFEFGFGRLVAHRTWAELREAYAFTGGNIWPLVLVVVTLSPLLTAWRAQRKRKA